MRCRLSISDPAALTLAAIILLAAGCSGKSVYQRPRSEAIGNQGRSWEAVLAPTGPQSEWEFARLDDSMNIRDNTEPDAPSLDDLVRIYLNPRADQVWYYRSSYRYRY